MKDKLDKYTVTIPRQIRKVIFTYLILSLVMGFFGLFLILQIGGIGAKIFGFLMMLVQIHFMYATGYDISDHDLKSYSILKPYLWKGFALYIPIAAVTIILSLLFNLVWYDKVIDSLIEVTVNFLTIVWIIPYYPIAIPQPQILRLSGIIISIVVPALFLGLGYIARMKNFDLSKFTDKLVYEKNNK